MGGAHGARVDDDPAGASARATGEGCGKDRRGGEKAGLVAETYKIVIGQGWLPPSEFWRLHPTELWWLIDAKRPRKMYGSMTEDTVRELYDELMAAEEAQAAGAAHG